jgi:diaminopimelate decarboxylase
MFSFPPDSQHISHEKIEGVTYQRLADSISTPFYVYSKTQIEDDFSQLKNQLHSDIRFFYSLKANSNKTLVNILHRAGAGCEVCSAAELEIALKAGVPAEQIIFVGPGKHVAELTQCCQAGIKAVVVESLEEMRLLNDIAASQQKIQTIAIRINPDFSGEKARLVMSGKPRQFGIDEQLLPEIYAALPQLTYLRLAGIHIYLGTRILDWQAIVNNTAKILALAAGLQTQWGIPFEFVDVGGGFGVRYFEKEKALDLTALGAGLNPLIAQYRQTFPDCQLIIELGRFLIARAGIFVTRINYLKPSREKWFAICDGGANCHGSAAGINTVIRRNYPMARLGSAVDRELHNYQVTGPLCTPTDLLGEDVMLSALQPGDLIGIGHSGAYGASASPVNFLSFGHPAEILVEGEDAFLIRTADTVKTLLAPHVCHALPLTSP